MEDRRTPARVWQAPEIRERPLRVGVVAFPYMANFTDFDALAMEPAVSLAFLEDPAHRFRTMTLPFDGGLELSVRVAVTKR